MFEFDTDVVKKLDAPSKRKIYDMLVAKVKNALQNVENVCLLGLCNWRYGEWLRKEFPSIKHITLVESAQLQFMYKDLEKLDMYNIIYVEDSQYIETLERLMKFDCIIQNPPYQKNLHLKILTEAIKHLEDDGVCVNLSPILWLEDPHAHMKTKSNLFKFKTSIIDKCDALDIINASSANALFNIGLYSNLGVYICSNHASGIDGMNFWKQNYKDWEISLFEQVYAMKYHLVDKCEDNKRDGIRVPIAFIAGNRGPLPIYKDLSYVIDGMKDGKDWTKCKNNGGYEKKEGCGIPVSIKFSTENEAQNFYDSWKTTFLKWLCRRFLFDQHIQLQFLPWMEDYSQSWDNARFYKFFNITSEEQKVIEKTMEKYE